jgi:acyl-CoA reductase-like NAD-dependent aldehyde dehydrogenase
MNPEAAEAIRIADKHLPEASVEQRKALALDIHEAIVRHGGALAAYAISEGIAKARQQGKH